ncbi:MAG: acyl-CoA dehydrogenase [Alphaproteobacteria bacterium]|nr:acyl-CoA dehydrogenase [Alphaproteobacteria bacterium]
MALAEFDWHDPFNITAQLSEEERMIAETAHKFAQSDLAPLLPRMFRDEMTDPNIFRAMGEQGLLGSGVAAEYGGSGLNAVAQGLIMREIERVDSGFRSMASVQSSLVMLPIEQFGSEAQKRHFLPKLATGEYIGCFGLTEPDHGSDPNGMVTRATKVAGGYQLSGAKTWITNAPLAHVLIVWAKLPDAVGNQAIRGFIIERENLAHGLKGLETPAIKGKVGLRTSVTGSIMLDECFVPDNHILPHVTGLKGPFTCLNSARFGIAWGAMGAAEDCLHIVRDYLIDRKQFGRPLAATQIMQVKLADMVTEIALGLQAALRLGRLKENDQAAPALISLLKRNNCGKALEIARKSRDMLGGNGISDEFKVARHMVNLEVVNTYEGTHDIHALILGREITGIAAF